MSEGALERKSPERPANKAAKLAQSEGAGDAAPRASASEGDGGQPERRKRGRPPKAAASAPIPQDPPRKRGRPRKHPLPAEPANAVPRKRGRPRKHPLPEQAAAPVATLAPANPVPPAVAALGDPATAARVEPATQAAPAPRETPAPPRAPAPAAPGASRTGLPAVDFNALALNMARFIEEGGKALAAYMRPLESGKTNPDLAEHVEDAVKTLGHVAEYWMADPARAVEAQAKLSSDFISLWGATMRRFAGETVPPVAEPDPGDKRFSDPEWSSNPLFDFLRQAYVITTRWANGLVDNAEAVDPGTREKANFYLRQIAGAVSPSNFIGTNPELLRTTLSENAGNLVRGMKMLAEDIEAGSGALKIRQSDPTKFELGRDLAMTPGKVIFRNELMELIQYTPQTPQVFRRPLLIVPPWINKFYVLDLNPEKSFVRFCVENGLTVFVISWVNPDARHASKSFEDYIREGVFEALDAIHTATGERKVTAIGYCVGGTLLSIALALMAAKGDDRIDSATLFTTQVDFTDAGDLKLFVDSARIGALEEKMRQTGYLEGAKMASAFNMLRPERADLGLFRQQLPEGQGADALRPADVEFRFHAHARGQSFVLPSQLLSRQHAGARRDGHVGPSPRPQGREDTDLRSGRARGPHRARALGVRRREAVRRTGALRSRWLRPYRGRDQSRPQAEVPILDRRRPGRNLRRMAREREREPGHVVDRLAQVDRGAGARPRARPRAGRRQAHPAVRRAGRIRAREGLTAASCMCGARN